MEDPWEETVDPAETASEDEVEKHVNNVLREDEYVVAQDMPDLARARMFLENGRPIQVRCALQMIPMLFAESQQELVKDLFPVFKKWLLEAPTESNVEDREELLALAGDSLCTAAETGSMPHAAASKHVWPLTKQMLESSKSEVKEAWVKLAVEILQKKLLGLSEIEKEVLPFVIEEVCAVLVGALALAIPPERIRAKHAPKGKPARDHCSLFSRAMGLCQDTEHDIRGTLCTQLGPLAEGLFGGAGAGVEDEGRVKELGEELIELLRDEDSRVRAEAVKGVVAVMKYLAEDQAKKLAEAVAVDVYEKYADRSEEIMVLAHNVGPVFVSAWGRMSVKGRDIMRRHIAGLPGIASPEARAAGAFNLPGVLHAMGASHYLEHLHSTVERLTVDEDPAVRGATARCLPGIAQQISAADNRGTLLPLFVCLAQDPAVEVQAAIVSALPAMLPRLLGEAGEEGNVEVCAAVGGLHGRMIGEHRFWRQELLLLQALGGTASNFAAANAGEGLIPSLLSSMGASSPQVSRAAARTLLAILQKSRNAQLRLDTCEKVVRQFARAESYYRRTLFCELCQMVPIYFSSNFFKICFMDAALAIATDKVPLVRSRACLILPTIKDCLKLPFDSALLTCVLNSLIRLTKDSDPGVVEAAKGVSDEVYRMDRLKPDATDAADTARREDEEKVHGKLERGDYISRVSGTSVAAKHPGMIKRAPSIAGSMAKPTSDGKGQIRRSLTEATGTALRTAASAAKAGPLGAGSGLARRASSSGAMRDPSTGAADSRPTSGNKPVAGTGAATAGAVAGAG
ncbi:armadillo-type protein, partial [Baffinella frigidus]